MGRPRHAVRSVKWTLYIPEDVATKVDLFILDPVYGKVRGGYRSQLMERLLRKWLQDKVHTMPPEGSRATPTFPVRCTSTSGLRVCSLPLGHDGECEFYFPSPPSGGPHVPTPS